MADDLTRVEIEALRSVLEAAVEEMRRSLRTLESASQVVELDQPTMGRLSRVDAIQSQQMAKANRDSTRLRLRQVEAALERLDDEDYGRCRRCEEPIGMARLRIRPEAALCVECQQERERR